MRVLEGFRFLFLLLCRLQLCGEAPAVLFQHFYEGLQATSDRRAGRIRASAIYWRFKILGDLGD